MWPRPSTGHRQTPSVTLLFATVARQSIFIVFIVSAVEALLSFENYRWGGWREFGGWLNRCVCVRRSHLNLSLPFALSKRGEKEGEVASSSQTEYLCGICAPATAPICQVASSGTLNRSI